MLNLKSLIRLLYTHPEGFLLCVFTFLLLTDVLLGIAARYIHFDIVFADEVGKYLFIWLSAIGISAAAKDNQHVRLTYFVSFLPVSRKASWIVSQVLFLCFCFFFFIWGIQLTWMHFTMEKSVMGFKFPMYLFTAALPFGFALTAIRLVQDIRNVLSKNDPAHPWEVIEQGRPTAIDATTP